MNREDALNLCRMAKAICPAQAIDDFTPDAWALVLEDDRYEDARQALKELSREQPFVHVSEIVKRIKRIRSKRVADFGPLPDPPKHIDPDDTAAHIRWLDETTEAIGDGTYQRPEPQALERRNLRELGQAKSVDAALAGRDSREAIRQARMELQAAAVEEKRAKDEKRAEMERMRQADRAARAAKEDA